MDLFQSKKSLSGEGISFRRLAVLIGVSVVLTSWGSTQTASRNSEGKKTAGRPGDSVFFLDGPPGVEPSGLTQFKGTLFSVSDKHDQTIFKVDARDGRASFQPHLNFQIEGESGGEALDFEGITVNEDGVFYLISESQFRILEVLPSGKAQWICESLKEAGEKAGLFATEGACLEGIVWLGDLRFLLCAERQPRGIVQVDLRSHPPGVRAFTYDKVSVEFASPRSPDFTGLGRRGDEIFIVQRNADTLTRIKVGDSGLVEHEHRSFRDLVMDEKSRYADMKFSKCEGVAFSQDGIYLIFDNNRIPRLNLPLDNRPMLIRLEK